MCCCALIQQEGHDENHNDDESGKATTFTPPGAKVFGDCAGSKPGVQQPGTWIVTSSSGFRRLRVCVRVGGILAMGAGITAITSQRAQDGTERGGASQRRPCSLHSHVPSSPALGPRLGRLRGHQPSFILQLISSHSGAARQHLSSACQELRACITSFYSVTIIIIIIIINIIIIIQAIVIIVIMNITSIIDRMRESKRARERERERDKRGEHPPLRLCGRRESAMLVSVLPV